MPTLAGGKPNRVALARLAAELEPSRTGRGQRHGAETDPAASADPSLALLAEGWREVLGHSRFTAASHFFRTGGHSLLAAQLAAWLEPRIGARPPLRLLFQNPVLSDQARALGALATPTVAAHTATTTPTES